MKSKIYQVVIQEWPGSRWQPQDACVSVDAAKEIARKLVKSINRPGIRARIINILTGKIIRNTTITKGDV